MCTTCMYSLSVTAGPMFSGSIPQWVFGLSTLTLGFLLTWRKQLGLSFRFVNVRFDTDP